MIQRVVFPPHLSSHTNIPQNIVFEEDAVEEDSGDEAEDSGDEDGDEESDDDAETDSEMPPLIEEDSEEESDAEEDAEEKNAESQSIKIISMDTGEKLMIDELEPTEPITSSIENIDLSSDIQRNESIRVEKLDDTNETETLDNSDSNKPSESSKDKDMYRRLPIQTLKSMVISKGLCTDPNRMKKIDLIKMLEDEDAILF